MLDDPASIEIEGAREDAIPILHPISEQQGHQTIRLAPDEVRDPSRSPFDSSIGFQGEKGIGGGGGGTRDEGGLHPDLGNGRGRIGAHPGAREENRPRSGSGAEHSGEGHPMRR
jgi:hypothetical protein